MYISERYISEGIGGLGTLIIKRLKMHIYEMDNSYYLVGMNPKTNMDPLDINYKTINNVKFLLEIYRWRDLDRTNSRGVLYVGEKNVLNKLNRLSDVGKYIDSGNVSHDHLLYNGMINIIDGFNTFKNNRNIVLQYNTSKMKLGEMPIVIIKTNN